MIEHRHEGEVDVWESPRGKLRMWTPAPAVVMSLAEGYFDVALAQAFLAWLEPRIAGGTVLTGLHDWSALVGYAPETRKLFTRWTDEHRSSFHRIVIYTESRLVRMGIATAKLVLGSIVEAVATRAELERLLAEAAPGRRKTKTLY
ncbi:MAG TPA: hypothetical protein VFF06_07725 [Polyangia bacterium]|nr:hypothetical protein [Polyangia bacterium]